MGKNLVMFLYASIVVLIFGWGTVFYWTAFEQAPVVVTGVDVVTPEVRHGALLVTQYSLKEAPGCDIEKRFFLRDAEKVVIEIAEPIEKVEQDKTSYSVRIPNILALGPALFWGSIKSSCNPIRHHVVNTPPTAFTIVK